MLSNKNCYERNKKFAGSLTSWFNRCVDSNDLFRFWWKGLEDAECDYYYIVNVIEIPGDYLLGLSTYDDSDKADVTIWWRKLSEVSEFCIVPDEEKYIER